MTQVNVLTVVDASLIQVHRFYAQNLEVLRLCRWEEVRIIVCWEILDLQMGKFLRTDELQMGK